MNLTLPGLDSVATLAAWLVAEGDTVDQGQPLAIVVTESQELALPAATAGRITALLVDVDSTLAAGAALAQLDAATAAPAATLRATPLARAIASHADVDLHTLVGSGIQGRIVKRDVLAVLEPDNRAPAGAFCVAEQMGQRAADQVIHVPAPAPPRPTASSDIRRSTLQPHPALQPVVDHATAYVALACDVSAMLNALQHQQPLLARRGLALTPAVCIAYATAQALAHLPAARTEWSDDGLVQRAPINLGLRTAQGETLVANAADLSLSGMARQLQQPPTATPPPLSGWIVFSATSTWWSSTPLPATSSWVLHAGAIQKQPVVAMRNGQEQLVIQPQLTLTLSYDARALSDSTAHRLLQQICHTLAAL